jgi:mRNA-degrading endonuclease RelE of RelBE toxin-antitoxin system
MSNIYLSMAWSVEISDKALRHLEKFERKIRAKLLNINVFRLKG